jgi:uncharacterized protein (TIGR03083 family)
VSSLDAEPEYRSETTLVGSERHQLEAFVEDNRDEILRLLSGLTEEQARRRLVSSKTTLLGLVKHAAFVEGVWFPVALAGHAREELGLPDHPDDSFDLAADDTIASVSAGYAAAAEESRRIAASYELDDLALHNRRGPLTLRWVLIHLVEELARHAGHGEILREQVLASDRAGRAISFHGAALREEYAAAGAALVELAAAVPTEGWDGPGLGDWSVRDLVGHAGRSFVTVSTYLASGAGKTPELGHPLDYGRVFRSAHADPAAITERGRQAGRDLGEDPVTGLRAQYDEAVAAVAAHPDDAPVDTPAGVMRLADYLPSRVFELVVHTDDLARALGTTAPGSPSARTIAATFAAGLAAEGRDDTVLLRGLTGRGGLPEDFTAL